MWQTQPGLLALSGSLGALPIVSYGDSPCFKPFSSGEGSISISLENPNTVDATAVGGSSVIV